MSARRLSIPLLELLIGLTACRESKVTAYRIPKEKEIELPDGHPPAGMVLPGADVTAGAMPGSDMANAAPVPTASGPGLTWTAPADWQLQPPAPMRKATFAVAGPEGSAELTVTAFPGDVGGELANVNRWRGQVGFAPLTAETLDQNLDRIESNSLHVAIVDITDPAKPKGTLGAIIPYSGGTWFFKLSGPTASVQRQKQVFLTFLKTVKGAQP